jgi:hypothetical protein
MELPQLLIRRFPPSDTQLFNILRPRIDDAMLRVIAEADYGNGEQDAFTALREIRDNGRMPVLVPFELSEVLALTRWSTPDKPNPPPYQLGPAGSPGHLTRLFACAVLYRLSVDPDCKFEDISEDSTLATCLESAAVLGVEFNQALARLLTWHLEISGFPVLVALALLTLATRETSPRFTEPELGELAAFVLSIDSEERKEDSLLYYGELPPAPFAMMQGKWDNAAQELRQAADSVSDPFVRESLQLCALLFWLQ